MAQEDRVLLRARLLRPGSDQSVINEVTAAADVQDGCTQEGVLGRVQAGPGSTRKPRNDQESPLCSEPPESPKVPFCAKVVILGFQEALPGRLLLEARWPGDLFWATRGKPEPGPGRPRRSPGKPRSSQDDRQGSRQAVSKPAGDPAGVSRAGTSSLGNPGPVRPAWSTPAIRLLHRQCPARTGTFVPASQAPWLAVQDPPSSRASQGSQEQELVTGRVARSAVSSKPVIRLASRGKPGSPGKPTGSPEYRVVHWAG